MVSIALVLCQVCQRTSSEFIATLSCHNQPFQFGTSKIQSDIAVLLSAVAMVFNALTVGQLGKLNKVSDKSGHLPQ